MVKVKEMIQLWESRIESANTIKKNNFNNNNKLQSKISKKDLISNDCMEVIRGSNTVKRETKKNDDVVGQKAIKEPIKQLNYKYSIPEVIDIINKMIIEKKKARIVLTTTQVQNKNSKKKKNSVIEKPQDNCKNNIIINDYQQIAHVESNELERAKTNIDLNNKIKKKKKWLDKKRWETMSDFKDRLKKYYGK